MNSELGPKIGEGNGSDVYAWGSNKVIKLAKPNTNLYAIQREYENHCLVWEKGLSVPQPFEIKEIDGRLGILYERIKGESLLGRYVNQAMSGPVSDEERMRNIRTNACITAEWLYGVHQHSCLKLPSQREIMKFVIGRADCITVHEKDAVLALLERLPVKQQLCHGDPNPGNIMIRNGRIFAIDWLNAAIGNPEADIAEYIITMKYAELPAYLPGESANYINGLREASVEHFVHEYSSLSGITFEEINSWIAPVAACKLSADIGAEERARLLHDIRTRL
ncbi:phosphotransferase [Paenibacillus ginsengarvi]|uniref:Aminoglycoside phosphotransferase n=1 Tax=Paenibacillus ginsengarvi TaxID=400777 RepID=A0A3B0CIH4_9BACL|nr:phosphotransferase [Paenibacillus ginsengarvi]RKN84374.1 aminoglycoside phosphotransferase [Paenibacillus ginsengarvi]